MNLIQTRGLFLRFIFAVLVIGVFAENTRTSAQFDSAKNDGNSIFYKAAILSKSLAGRNHTIIATVNDLLITQVEMKNKIEELSDDRVKYVKSICDDYKYSLQNRIQSTIEFAASNEVAINRIFGSQLRNDENNTDQLKAQIISQQLIAPMKVIQSLLSFAIAQYPRTIELDSKVPDLNVRNKTQLLAQINEQLKLKSRLFKKLLDDFDLVLKQDNSELISVQRTSVSLATKVDEILASNKSSTVNMIESLYSEWKNLVDAIANEKPHFDAQNSTIQMWLRVQNLLKCSAFGMTAYKDCRDNLTKSVEFSEQVDKLKDELPQWQEYEQSIFSAVIPVLKEIEKLTENELAAKLNSLISSNLPKLDRILMEIQQHPLYSSDLDRAIEDTKQLIRMTISMYNHIQVLTDKESLLLLLQEIQKTGPELSEKEKIFNNITTINLMLELCLTTREVLKMRVIPLYQDYLELCDIPSTPTTNHEFVKRNLLENIRTLQEKIWRISIYGQVEGGTFIIHGNRVRYDDPIYVWKYNSYKTEITNLLKGQKVILNANVVTAPANKSLYPSLRDPNAEKFTKILLDFSFSNETRQNEFKRMINGISVELKLIGDNYYRCDERIYYIRTDVNYPLAYRIKSDGQMDITEPNDLYSTVLERDDLNEALLSPYNVWQIQLVIDSEELRRKLSEFNGEEIDLQLKGEKIHLMNTGFGKDVCYNDKLLKNYRLERILET